MMITKNYNCKVIGNGTMGSPRRFTVQAMTHPTGTTLYPSSPRLDDGTQLVAGDELVVTVTTTEEGHEAIRDMGIPEA